MSDPHQRAVDQGLTRYVASNASELSFNEIPAEAQETTKLIVLDTLGAMIAAANPSFGGTQRFTAFLEADCPTGNSPVIGTALTTSSTNAALIGGYLGYAMDIESHHGPSIMHAAAATLPAAFAVGHERNVSGTEFLSAFLSAIEVACRVSNAIGPKDLYSRGFHPSAVAGAFGASVAAGRLLGLDVAHMENAFGLAATQAAGLLAWASDHTEESRPFNPGIAARNGLTAARLADAGFGAPQAILDPSSEHNVYRSWSLDRKGQPERLVRGDDEPLMISDLTVKLYACCAFLHPGLDGLLDILSSENLPSNDVASIVMRFAPSGAPIIDNNPLRSHCAQYILPVATVRGEVRFDDVIHDCSGEPEIQRLREVTELVHDDQLEHLYPDRYATIMEVTTKSGQTLRRRVDSPLGTPQNPVSPKQMHAKFERLAGPRLGDEHTTRVIEVVDRLDKANDLRELVDAVRVS